MIKSLNENIIANENEEQLNERLVSELEERTEFGCWGYYMNNGCKVNYSIT